jgi:ATP-dependent Lon protease
VPKLELSTAISLSISPDPDTFVADVEVDDILRFAIECRKRVKDQLMRLDSTYQKVNFSYTAKSGQIRTVHTLEEDEYPAYYYRGQSASSVTDDVEPVVSAPVVSTGPVTRSAPLSAPSVNQPKERHQTIQESQKGISFDKLFGPYLVGATSIRVIDPYIRAFHQVRNFMELLETIINLKAPEDEVAVHLVTTEDDYNLEQQRNNLNRLSEAAVGTGVVFSWEFDSTGTIHARSIVPDSGWKISLDRGLDIFQPFEFRDSFAFANKLQQYRACKAFEVTFIKLDGDLGTAQ